MQKKLKTLLDHEIDPVFKKRAEFIFKEIEREKPGAVLDVGCGRGFYTKALTQYKFIKKIVGLDTNPKYLNVAAKINNSVRVRFVEGSIYALPFKESLFDLIICSEVLEHLINERRALAEMSRVLKPGGVLLITVPNRHFPPVWDPINWFMMRFFNTHINKDIWFLAGMWADHVRLYSEIGLKSIFKNTDNLNIEKTEKIVSFAWPFSHFILYGIGKNIVERLPIGEFYRFSQSKGKMSYFLARFFEFPTKLSVGNSFVNLLLKARKTSHS